MRPDTTILIHRSSLWLAALRSSALAAAFTNNERLVDWEGGALRIAVNFLETSDLQGPAGKGELSSSASGHLGTK
jgi:hypothetical protein